MYKNFFKRIIDFFLAFTGLIVLSPIGIIVYLILLFINKGNPFFYQRRPGKDEKIFNIIKFKSMTDKKDENGILLPDADRVTKFGTFIRKTSLDEIPQLINIIKGDMSLIGPRPLRVRYLPYYTTEEKIRHTVKPGVTGLAQISGRNLLNWDDKLAKDVEYVKKLSFSNDVSIFFKTIRKVFVYDNTLYDPEMLDLKELRSNNTKEA
ncbi:sugar transferase [Flavivirga spongiicola]|uniref:Sugar transferase n=1 Tax=Flavivirga spongiicola TaxID=421621 RepID=A0ABU7XY49_9FLAO|nr:sugar transferase [Flavivirga sp. MEBiC05379]MDO5980473.1 sugar transferase [Flavivirga sp. MEBiC05379]